MFPPVSVQLSGERLLVTYGVAGDEESARKRARDVCLEQTVELGPAQVPAGAMTEGVVGQLESLTPLEPGFYEAVISYAIETSGFELVQLMSLVFSNISMMGGVRVQRIDLPDSLTGHFQGPRFGREGLRYLLGNPDRPLLGTALKPMGYPAEKLAEFAYQFALGGIDVIKDDHGLADQPFAPFYERARLCSAAVARANRETGGQSMYVANVSGPVDQLTDKAIFAREVGVGGIELYPGLVGFDNMRLLAEQERLGLPIFAHPAFLGTYTLDRSAGLAHEFIYGQIMRLAGADVVIFAGHGGRFPTTAADSQGMVDGATRPMGQLAPVLPMVGGGMTVGRVPELVEFYGREVILLISGGLYSLGPDLVANCRRFTKLVGAN